MELDDEDYDLLGVARPDVFEEVVRLEAHKRLLEQLPKRRRKPLTAAQKFMAAYRARLKYVPKPRKPKQEPWAKRNPEKDAERKLKWYYAHREQVRKQQAEWRAKNPNYMKDYAKRKREKRNG